MLTRSRVPDSLIFESPIFGTVFCSLYAGGLRDSILESGSMNSAMVRRRITRGVVKIVVTRRAKGGYMGQLKTTRKWSIFSGKRHLATISIS